MPILLALTIEGMRDDIYIGFLCVKVLKWRDKTVGSAGLERSDKIREVTACLDRLVGR